MKQIRTFLAEVKNYCNFSIEFDKTNQLYKFNDLYVDEINHNMFQEKIDNFKVELVSILKMTGKPLPLINDLLSELRFISEPYRNEELNKFSNLKKLDSLLVVTEKNPIIKLDIGYTLDELNEFDTINDENKDELFYYLITKRSIENPFKNYDQIKKIKFHYTVLKYFESISLFEEFLEELKINIEKYNFTEYDDLLPSDYRQRCTVKFNKMETAYFFNALFDSGILFFPGYTNKNCGFKRNLFIDDNFNYVYERKSNRIEKISLISKEFQKINDYKRKEKNIEIIEQLIEKLEEIRSKI
jgi:hypothetical protein